MQRLKDREIIRKILVLRCEGVSYSKIGKLYNKHHTTIIDICRKNNIIPGSPRPSQYEVKVSASSAARRDWKPSYLAKITPTEILRKEELVRFQDDEINVGKLSYHDYLKSAGVKKYSVYEKIRTV